jgi:predicted NodU family carbamoyl transferase
LGNRSILADPRVASHKETINAMIKMGESYLLRPDSKSMMVSESLSNTQMRIAGEVGDC